MLLTGATGALGPAAIRALVASGFEVRALTRSPGPAEAAGIAHAVGDLADRASLERAVEGMDVVVHLAALLHIANPAPDLRSEYHRINVEGTQSLADAAARAGVRRFVLASTAAVYGPTSAPATESTRPAPDSWYGESKLAAEGAVLGAHRPEAFDVTVLRLCAVYGPRIKGNYERLLRALASGRFVPVGPGMNRRSLIHEDDAAAALVAAAQHPSARGRHLQRRRCAPPRVAKHHRGHVPGARARRAASVPPRRSSAGGGPDGRRARAPDWAATTPHPRGAVQSTSNPRSWMRRSSRENSASRLAWSWSTGGGPPCRRCARRGCCPGQESTSVRVALR